MWLSIKESQIAQLSELAQLVTTVQQRKPSSSSSIASTSSSTVKQQQPSQDLELLIQLASALQEWYQMVVESWAAQSKAAHRRARMKQIGRVQEKVQRSYAGNVARVLDFVRSTIIVTSIDQATQTLELVISQAIVFSVKNRLDLNYDGKATAGYRDINVQLSFPELDGTIYSGFVFELQIILDKFFQVKSEEGHKRYIHCRNLRGE